MQIPAPAYRCPLGPMQPERPDLEAVKREGWQSQRILVVSDADPRLDLMHLFGYVDANECFHEVSPLRTTRQLFLADFALHSDGSRSLISGRKGKAERGEMPPEPSRAATMITIPSRRLASTSRY